MSFKRSNRAEQSCQWPPSVSDVLYVLKASPAAGILEKLDVFEIPRIRWIVPLGYQFMYDVSSRHKSSSWKGFYTCPKKNQCYWSASDDFQMSVRAL
mmetsp:Transcript_5900/g.12426  ORF Transcript_5900/g.12426 Transcript_5900/m.12426 type:complete len:97 (+) Transcript_5900:496-786(+)